MLSAAIRETTRLRRLVEASRRDRTPERVFEDLQEGIDAGQVKLENYSIRGLFESLIDGGRELVDSWDPRQGGGGYSMGEALHRQALIEEAGAVTSTAFSRITGQLVVSAVLEKYMDESFVFTPLVKAVDTPFNGEKIPGISRIGDEADVVPEGREYPRVGVSEDYIETPETRKRGMIDALTREAVFFDRTGLVVERCGEVGYFLGVNKEKRIIDAVIDENVTAHRYKWKGTTYATFQTSTPWVNSTTSNALVDWTDIDAVEQVMANLTDPYTGEPIQIVPKHLIVTRDLLYTARRIVNATEITMNAGGYATSGNLSATKTTANPIQGYQIVSSALLKARLGTDTSWFVGDIGKAVKYMQNFPLTVVQAPANSQAEFERDIVMQWKASERGAAAVVEPRALGKSAA